MMMDVHHGHQRGQSEADDTFFSAKLLPWCVASLRLCGDLPADTSLPNDDESDFLAIDLVVQTCVRVCPRLSGRLFYPLLLSVPDVGAGAAVSHLLDPARWNQILEELSQPPRPLSKRPLQVPRGRTECVWTVPWMQSLGLGFRSCASAVCSSTGGRPPFPEWGVVRVDLPAGVARLSLSSSGTAVRIAVAHGDGCADDVVLLPRT